MKFEIRRGISWPGIGMDTDFTPQNLVILCSTQCDICKFYILPRRFVYYLFFPKQAAAISVYITSWFDFKCIRRGITVGKELNI